MAYENTIDLLDKIRNTEIEVKRFANPTKTAKMPLNEFEKAKKQAIEKTKDFNAKLGLQNKVNALKINEHYSDEHEKNKAELDELLTEEVLYVTLKEDVEATRSLVNSLENQMNTEITKAIEQINIIIAKTDEKTRQTLQTLKEIEMDESYVFESNNKFNNSVVGVHAYLNYVDEDADYDEYIKISNKSKSIKPVMKLNRTDNAFAIDRYGNKRYKNFNLRSEILGGVK